MMKWLVIPLLAVAVTMASAKGFKVTSPDLHGGRFTATQAMNGFGCQGDNISPSIHWTGEPAGTESFVVSIYDPDAPTGSGFWHWVVVNIPADVHELVAGAGNDRSLLPAAALQTYTDVLQPGYMGPCPPAGEKHRYRITVFALPVESLDIPARTSAAMVGFMVHGQALDRATLTATYQRP